MKHIKTFEAYAKSQTEGNVEDASTDTKNKKVAKLTTDENENIVIECDGNSKTINVQEIEEGDNDSFEEKFTEALQELGATHIIDEKDESKEVELNEFLKRLFARQQSHKRVLHHIVGKK